MTKKGQQGKNFLRSISSSHPFRVLNKDLSEKESDWYMKVALTLLSNVASLRYSVGPSYNAVQLGNAVVRYKHLFTNSLCVYKFVCAC